MWSARVSCLLAACANSGSFAVGPTLDGDGHVGIEVVGSEGPVTTANEMPDLPGQWIVGLQGIFGATTGHPRVLIGIGGYVEYLRFGTLQSPWRFHARLGFEASSWAAGSIALKLDVGPNHLGSEYVRDSNDGPWTYKSTSGVDLSLRVGLHLAPDASPWKLGLLYVRQESVL